MNEEQNTKLDWCFDSLKFFLENNSTFDEVYKQKLLDDADRIEIDFTKEDKDLEKYKDE